MNEVKNPILAPNKIFALIAYLLITFIGGGVIIIVVAYIYANANKNIDSMQLIEALANANFLSDDNLLKVSDELLKGYCIVNAIGNMISYLLALFLVLFFVRDLFLKDTKDLKSRIKFFAVYIPITSAAFFGLSFLLEFIYEKANIGVSENQNSIIYMILGGGAVPTFISVVICAPLVEELIYRKVFSEMLKNRHIAVFYVVSSLIFALPHMLSTPMDNFGIWLLLSLPYLFSGIMLCAIYHFSGKNVYASWSAHLVNNLIAFIQIASYLGVVLC